jgi:hypothetical protein
MSTNEKKPRRTFDQDFIDGAVKLVTQEGYSLALRPRPLMFPTRLFVNGAKNNRSRAPRRATRLESNNSNLKIANFESSYGRPSWSVES